MDNVELNQTVTIKKITIKDSSVKKRLESLGFLPNTSITKVSTTIFNNPSIIKIESNYIAINNQVLKDIEICE